MGRCQDQGPFWGTLNNKCRIILGTPKGTIILTTTQMTSAQWLLIIQSAPTPAEHQPETMLLTAGDRLLFELVDDEWILRIEHLNPEGI